MEERDFEKLKTKVLHDTGFDLNQYSQDYVKRRLGARMLTLGLTMESWADYIKVIESNREEYAKLFDFFSINVTEFFRDPSLWKKLRLETIPKIIAEKKASGSNCLRIWSAGCSTGEEPYSLSIILKELLPKDVFLTYFATDIDPDALAKAQEGLYSKESLKNIGQVDQLWLNRYFTKELDPKKNVEKYRISNDIKKMVTFKKHNFLADKPISSVDLVICRNAMIYISPTVKDRLLGIFHQAMVQHGYLIVGKSEIINLGSAKSIFYAIDIAEHIYRKERRLPEADAGKAEAERRKNWWPGKTY